MVQYKTRCTSGISDRAAAYAFLVGVGSRHHECARSDDQVYLICTLYCLARVGERALEAAVTDLHRVIVRFPGRGTLTIAEMPCEARYSLANMQVWSEPASAPDHEFVCFELTVSSEDALNRPADRLNIASHSSRQIVLQLIAKPL